tara:strand:- start:3938 stop:4627 length:690 start_codon:yes stop_codon:yes gene_type:complete
MKIIKISLLSIIALFSAITASEKEEIKTFVKDGITYNVNLSSNHISTDQKIAARVNNKSLSPSGFKLYTNFGHFSPLGENLKNHFNPGYSIGAILQTPKSFNLFKKDWVISVSGKYSKLPSRENSDYNQFSMMDFLTHFSTNFGPILFDIGAGISRTNSISSIASINETALTGSIDIGYSIIKQDDLDLILNLNLRYTTSGPEFSINNSEDSTSELMGLSLKFGKNINL